MYLKSLLFFIEQNANINAFAKLAEIIESDRELDLDDLLDDFLSLIDRAKKSVGFHWLICRYLGDDINYPNLHINENLLKNFKRSLLNVSKLEDFNTAPTKGRYKDITLLFCMTSGKRGREILLYMPKLLYSGDLLSGPSTGKGAGWTPFLCLTETPSGLEIIQKYPKLLTQENLNKISAVPSHNNHSGFNRLATASEGKRALLSRPELLCEYIYTSLQNNMHITHHIKYWLKHGDLLVEHPKALLEILFKFRQAKALDYFLKNIDPTRSQANVLKTLGKLAKAEIKTFDSMAFYTTLINSLKSRQAKVDILNTCIEMLSSSFPKEISYLISYFYLIKNYPELKQLNVDFIFEFLYRIEKETFLNKLAVLVLSGYRTNEVRLQAKCIKDIIHSSLQNANEDDLLAFNSKEFRDIFITEIKTMNFEDPNCVNKIETSIKIAKNRYQTFSHPIPPLNNASPNNDNTSFNSL